MSASKKPDEDESQARSPGALHPLRAGDSLYRALAANLPGGAVFVVDRELRYILAEGEALATAGMVPADLEGKTIFEVLQPELVALYEPLYRRALAGERFEWEHHSHGHDYLSRGVPLFDEAGEIDAALAVSYDISARKQVEAALQKSEERFRRAVENLMDALAIYSAIRDDDGEIADFRVEYVNQVACELTGRERKNYVGRTLLELYPNLRQTPIFDWYLHVVETGEPLAKVAFPFDGRVHGGEGVRYYDYRIARLGDGFTSAWQDVTARQRAEEALRERGRELARLNETLEARVEARTEALRQSHERLKLALGASKAGIYDHQVPLAEGTYHDGRWADILGYNGHELPPPQEFLAWLYARVHPDDLESMQESYDSFVDGLRPDYDVQVRLRHKSGAWRWVRSLSHAAARDDAGRVTRVVGVMVDITDLKQAEQAARRLASELTLAEQKERDRIAQILHDKLQQQLYAMQLQLTLLQAAFEDGDKDGFEAQMSEVEEELVEALATTRELNIDLSPAILHDEGLTEAFGWLATQMEEQHLLQVTIEATESFPVPDEGLRVLLFQAVRELLFNVVKHSGARQATVRLQREDGHTRITVHDDGQGFDREAVLAGALRGGGLANVRHRLSLVGGEMAIDTAPGDSTRVALTVPLQLPDA